MNVIEPVEPIYLWSFLDLKQKAIQRKFKIMSGMNTTGSNSISSYGSRTVTLHVAGVCRQDVLRTSNYSVKVPYSRMSQTIQNISRMGGKIANVSLGEAAVVNTTPPGNESESRETEQKKRTGGKKNRSRK